MNFQKLGIMQGRLSPPKNNNIQHFPVDNWEKEFLILKELDLSNIQWVYEKDNYEFNPLYSDPLSIQKISKETNIKVNSVILDYFMEEKIFNEDMKTISKNVEHMKYILSQCQKAGIKIIEIPFVDNSSLQNITDKNNFFKNLTSIILEAKNLDLFLSLETDLKPNDFLMLINSFEPQSVFINYDMGNSTSNNISPFEEIPLLHTFIKNIHIKDRKKNKGHTCPLGTGDTDFKNIFSLLNKYNYNGDFIIQGAREDVNDNNTNFIETILKYLKFLKNF